MENDFALIETIVTEEGTVKVYENGLLESFINEGATIDVPYLLEGKRKLESLGLGKKFYVLAEGGGFYNTSKKARQLSASAEYSNHIAAIAVMTSHVSIKYILELYLKIDKPVTPTKPFTDRKLAIEWLLEKMNSDKAAS